jgi:hypothetical protein
VKHSNTEYDVLSRELSRETTQETTDGAVSLESKQFLQQKNNVIVVHGAGTLSTIVVGA